MTAGMFRLLARSRRTTRPGSADGALSSRGDVDLRADAGGDTRQPVHVLLGGGNQVRDRLPRLGVHARHSARHGKLDLGHLGGDERGGERSSVHGIKRKDTAPATTIAGVV